MHTFDQWGHAVEGIVKILKARFPNLTTEQTLKLAHEIVKAVLAGQA